MAHPFDLSGKRALVTGGSRGIGLGIARSLAEAGAQLILAARSTESLEAAAASLAETGAEVRVLTLDLAEPDGLAGRFEQAVADFGAVDILVNNGGMTLRGPSESMPIEDFEKVLRVNLTSAFALSQAFARHRISRNLPGRIVQIASLMATTVRKQNAPYASSKGGLAILTKALAVDWAPYGITVNAIGPGYTQSELTRPLWEDSEFDAWVKQRTPVGRWAQPADIGAAAVFLASDEAAFITGQLLMVDGGMLATV